MMTETINEETWSVNEEESNFNLCVHCRAPFPVIPENSEITSRLTKALNSIFKLNYLTSFDLLRTNEKEPLSTDVDVLSLCPICQQLLFDLHQLYDNFLLLGQLDSNLMKQLRRLDEFMDSRLHQTFVNKKEQQNCLPFDENTFFTIIPSECQVTQSNNNNTQEPTTKTTSPTAFQPRVVLTRLPEKYTTSTVVIPKSEQEEDDDFSQDYGPDMSPPSSDEEKQEERKSKKVKTKASMKRELPKSSSKSSRKSKIQTKRKITSKRSKIKSEKSPASSRMSNEMRNIPKKQQDKDELLIKTKSMGHYLVRRTVSAHPCWYCRRKDFSTPEACLEHTRTEHVSKLKYPSSARVCVRCSKICTSDRRLQNHLKECEEIPVGVLLPKTHVCSTCSKSFGCISDLRCHMKIHEDRQFHCEQCPYRGKNNQAIKKHHRLKHTVCDDPKIQCDECPSLLKNEESFKMHKYNMHTAEGYQKYVESQKIYSAKLKEKRKAKSMANVTICEQCNIDFFSRLALFNHRRTVHGDNMGKEYICEICASDFTTQRSLNQHTQKVHSDERPFICEHCGKAFKVKTTLKSHVDQTHTEEGRLKYNEKTREKNKRRKLLAMQLAQLAQGQIPGQGQELKPYT